MVPTLVQRRKCWNYQRKDTRFLIRLLSLFLVGGVEGVYPKERDHLKTKATWGREGEGPSLGDIMLLLVTAMPETRSTVGFPRDKMH